MNNKQLKLIAEYQCINEKLNKEFVGKKVKVSGEIRTVTGVIYDDTRVLLELLNFDYIIPADSVSFVEEYSDNVVDFLAFKAKKEQQKMSA